MNRTVSGRSIDNAAKSDAADEPDNPVPVKLPSGFGMTKGGLYFTDQAKDDAEPMWVSQQFLHLEDADIAMDKFGHLKMVGKLIAQHTSKFDQTPVYDGDVVQAQRWRP